MPLIAVEEELLMSALCTEGVHSEEEVLAWIEARRHAYRQSVEPVPLEKLAGWRFDHDTGNLAHSSGKFFRIEGLDIKSNFGSMPRWSQPIVNQPEIGILGFVAKRLEGVLHLLVQAKMEPGNVNLIQISPTVQATKSNYTRVHGGKSPPFVDYFLGGGHMRVLADQLQSEQGARYLRKRNRNVIVQVSDETLVEPPHDFIWLTIGQLQRLMRFNNLVHLDCRSILGALPYVASSRTDRSDIGVAEDSFGASVLASIKARDARSGNSLVEVLSWLTRLRCTFEVQIASLPLRDVTDWVLEDGVIRHKTGRYFSIVGVAVQAGNREVSSWQQPLIHSAEGAIIGLVVQMRDGILHFLIQGRVEPGFVDYVELAPTVQCAPANYPSEDGAVLPAFVEFFLSPQRGRVRFDSMLSEEGGRFYHSQQRHIVIELDADLELDIPPNYAWLSLGQLQHCARFSGMLNIELRSILACVSPADRTA